MVQLKRFKVEAGQLLKIFTKVISTDAINVQNVPFDLIGILNHSGTVNTVHYTALLKDGLHWYRCDDSIYPSQVNEGALFSCDNYTLLFKKREATGTTGPSTQLTSCDRSVTTSTQTKQLKCHLQNKESCKVYYDMDQLEQDLALKKMEMERL